ncbi:MAG: hypothetical protein IPQ07_29885 [Myxococcales bacterium]|nr:hypothetical protein [Myxococcales bacterium]
MLATLGGCMVVPGSQSTFGLVGTSAMVRYRGGVGVHLSAFDRDDSNQFDLGAGYIAEGGGNTATTHGTYISLSRRLTRRLWLGGRAEQLWHVEDRALPSRGVVVRIAVRQHLRGVKAAASEGSSLVAATGAIATGAFVELGGREREGGSEIFAAIGVALDLPLLFSISGR